ncbi:calmodulin A like [Biomphalaria glabrata]|uniref:Calmodulin-A-like n=1 Tax=Biomphalaria glabrata TaxID=6526 RepID=A0A2C9L0V0_BIOGL|nr:calmodulin-A-like [Biomphalaria glabrata]KAI8741606.1 calmodulin A like calmodulin-A-like Cell adhesion/Shell formation [Biomphalaria glabrata]KAI8788260.1 calmodulin A like [Biomphalaria glabrata]
MWRCCCCKYSHSSFTETTAALYDVKEGFIVFDKNKDGLISEDEICTVFRDMDMPISQDDAKFLIREFDLDGDGYLDFSEFVAFMKRYIRASGDNGSLSMFFHFDRDGDGFISPSEFKDSMKLLGVNLSTPEAEAMLSPFFKNNEKKICYDDFRILMQRFI